MWRGGRDSKPSAPCELGRTTPCRGLVRRVARSLGGLSALRRGSCHSLAINPAASSIPPPLPFPHREESADSSLRGASLGHWGRRASRRATRPGDLLHAGRSKGLDRPLAEGVQHVQTTQRVAIPASGTRGGAAAHPERDRPQSAATVGLTWNADECGGRVSSRAGNPFRHPRLPRQNMYFRLSLV